MSAANDKPCEPVATADHPMARAPPVSLVTGGCGLVGQRLVEMLVERGAKKVVSFDIAPKPKDALDTDVVAYVQGDLTSLDDVRRAFQAAGQPIDCCFHIGALVGPYFPNEAYIKVNYHGTLHIIEACREFNVSKLVMSSSPSTRMDGSDINGLTEDEMDYVWGRFLQPYAETKAMGEKAALDANNTLTDDGKTKLLTVAIAPHQVYGPRDRLFLPNILAAAVSGKLRVFGDGSNMISMVHVDNYCHSLIIGSNHVKEGARCLGKFYIATDGAPVNFWRTIDAAVVGMGLPSLFSKFKLNGTFMYCLGFLSEMAGKLVGKRFKLNRFSVRMMLINRYFDITNIERDMGYRPIIPQDEAWRSTVEWFKINWLPTVTQS